MATDLGKSAISHSRKRQHRTLQVNLQCAMSQMSSAKREWPQRIFGDQKMNFTTSLKMPKAISANTK